MKIRLAPLMRSTKSERKSLVLDAGGWKNRQISRIGHSPINQSMSTRIPIKTTTTYLYCRREGWGQSWDARERAGFCRSWRSVVFVSDFQDLKAFFFIIIIVYFSALHPTIVCIIEVHIIAGMQIRVPSVLLASLFPPGVGFPLHSRPNWINFKTLHWTL